jgi:site-specific recombinase XerD
MESVEGEAKMDVMKTAQYVVDYLNKIQKDNDTMKAYSLDLEKFVNTFGERDITDLTKENLDEYLNALSTRSGKKVSVATQNRHYATLSCFFNYLLRAGSINDNPMKKI